MLTIFLWSNAWFSCIDGVAGIMPIITCPSCNSTNTRFCHERDFVENRGYCRKTSFIANRRLFGFVWCRLLRRHLGFDLDFAQISGLKIGGWQHCHLLAFLFCRRCNFPSSWCLFRRQPCPPYSPSRLWPLLRSHQVPLIQPIAQSTFSHSTSISLIMKSNHIDLQSNGRSTDRRLLLLSSNPSQLSRARAQSSSGFA